MEERLIELALECGAYKAAVIPQEQIVLSEQFREICATNACGMYGKSYACPPDIGGIGPLMERVRQYPKALLYQSVKPLEDSFDFEGMMAAGETHAATCRRIHVLAKELLGDRMFHLGGGGCRLCPTCARLENLPCRYPDMVLPPMEGCGVDVYQTVKDTDLKYINGQNTVTYFGLLLFEEG